MSGLSGDDMNQFEVFLTLAISLDREKLKAVIALPETGLGKIVSEALINSGTADRPQVESGFAMLKLTAFYLDELHKLFPSVPTTGDAK